MTKEEILPEISLEALKKGATRTHKRLIDKLSQDPDTQYLILIETSIEGTRKLITVGPKSQYQSIKSALNQTANDARAIAYLDSRQTNTPAFKRNRFGFKIKKPPTKSEESAIHTIFESQPNKPDNQENQLNQLQANLEEREIEITKMEEALIDRMNQHMEKTAELEQWEENLFHRESSIQQREEKLNRRFPITSEG